jgi:hypothetical protein
VTDEEITDCVRMLHRILQTDFRVAALSPQDTLVANMLYAADGQSSRRILMRLIDKLRRRTDPAQGVTQRMRSKFPGLSSEVANQFAAAFGQLSPDDLYLAISTIAKHTNHDVSSVDDDVYFFMVQNRGRLRTSEQLARTLFEYERKRSRRPIEEIEGDDDHDDDEGE